jgi:hypothetical protein
VISEYIETVRIRLRVALRDGDKNEVRRLEELMRMLMIDGDKTGEKMPWNKICPCCGSDLSDGVEHG